MTAVKSSSPDVKVTIGKTDKTDKTKLTIKGMTCASCVQAIENAVRANPAIQEATVSLLMESADITFDPTKITPPQIAGIISDIGYEAAVKTAPVSALMFVVSVPSLSTDTKAQITAAITALPYVESATADITNKQFRIKYAASGKAVDSVAIIADLAKAGITALVKTHAAGATKADEFMKQKQQTLEFYKRLFWFSFVFTVPVLIISMVLNYIPGTGLSTRIVGNFSVHSLLLFVLSTPVHFLAGYYFHKPAYQALRHGMSNMNVLISLGTNAAYLVAFVEIVRQLTADSDQSGEMHGMETGSNPFTSGGGAEMFFETSAALIFFAVLGRYLEAMAKLNTSEALTTLMSMKPTSAVLLIAEAGAESQVNQPGDEKSGAAEAVRYTEKEVDANDLKKNDLVKVLRGGKVPADGVVAWGEASVDESMLTGESMPVQKRAGDRVIGSTILHDGVLHVRVTHVGEESTLSQILTLMEDAVATKAPIQDYADAVSGQLVPIVVLSSLLTFVIWYMIVSFSTLPPDYMPPNQTDFLFAFGFALAVMVIACPCGLGLATPTAVMVGTGVGAKLGILIKGGQALETAHGVTSIVFDKTGTLTRGKPVVTAAYWLPSMRAHAKTLVYLVGSAELNSEHVLGQAVVAYAKETLKATHSLQQPRNFQAVSGRGLKCFVPVSATDSILSIGGHTMLAGTNEAAEVEVIIGNRNWLAENGIETKGETETVMGDFEAAGRTALAVAINKHPTGVLALADVLKPESKEVVRYLSKEMNIEVWMCTGDNRRTASVVAAQVGLEPDHVLAEVLPAGKYDLVKKLQAAGKVVAMIGDGINDSPALAQADLGLAVGTGADIALQTADIVLMKNDLRDVVCALHLSKTTLRRIKWNFMWAFLYNILSVPIAAGVFYHPPTISMRLPPEIAALAMAMSSVSVVCSSLWLKRYQKPLWVAPTPNVTPSEPTTETLHSNAVVAIEAKRAVSGSKPEIELENMTSVHTTEAAVNSCNEAECEGCGCGLIPRPGNVIGECTCPATAKCRLRGSARSPVPVIF